MITKSTRFVDLPHQIKQKLITINNKNKLYNITLQPLKSLQDTNTLLYTQLVNLQTPVLEKNLNYLISHMNNLKSIDTKMDMKFIENQLVEELNNLKNDVEMYRKLDCGIDFCGCIESTYKVLCKRFRCIKNNKSKFK
ncbi:hypothetical protein NAPIS_ORF01578 [Vairimorpha apis BRL 01]|uniref:Uncharacterized protein n=1 Tax=Vairimorpha apis BRL 01 TaxID=1037528 RepID=T0KZZ0_9MICR|nr:hypothetical protein NAPIS_ORF01578 [Vairimorpha apis BRL 01]